VIAPERPEVQHGDIAAFDSVTQTHMVARPTYNWNPQYRAVQHSSLSYVAGDHDVKVGYQFNRGYINEYYYSVSNYPSGLRAIFRDGVPDSVNTYNTPTDSEMWESNHSVYAQDKWTPLRRLTINAGLRLQKTTGGSPAACQVQTIFIAGQCFAGQRHPELPGCVPRLSVIYDVFRTGLTAVKSPQTAICSGWGVPIPRG
jgi:outer membrane receptor protein involved in Fe transport